MSMIPPNFGPPNQQNSVGPGQNPVLALLSQIGLQQGQPSQPALPPPNPMVNPGMGAGLSQQMAQIGAQAPTPPLNPVVDMYDNAPPIVREAIRRRLFTQGM